uniref:Uncharacterized protein n=1 Tax=Anopheles arabiensis TaxID=7173 RepID=A0A182HPH7_ANOAR
MIFEGVAEERIDDDFRDGNYPIGHQKHHTPLAELRETQAAVRKEENQYPIFKCRGEEVILFVKEGLMLRKGNRNGWFLTKDREIIRYSAALEESGKVYIIGHLLKKKKVSFSTPCSSDIIFNYEGEIADLSKEL